MTSDYEWLDKWASKIHGKRTLELGCGRGIDTRRISKMAKTLVACDVNPAANLDDVATIMCIDHSKVLPFANREFDVVIASLSLHYFDWQTTEQIIQEISRVLLPGGILLCRLNSENDVNYGAVGNREIEPGLYKVNGAQKRFFSKSDIFRLLAFPWIELEIEHKVIDRYLRKKAVWELCVQNAYSA